MSSDEPVSAYSVFRTAMALAGNKKKTKNTKTKSANAKKNKGVVKKKTFGSVSNGIKTNGKSKTSKVADQRKSVKVNGTASVHKSKTVNNKAVERKQKAAPSTSKPVTFSESEVTKLVEQLYADDSRKLSKAELSKKKDLEDYLVRQLEKDDDHGDDSESYDSELYSDSVDDSFQSSDTDEESPITNGNGNDAAEVLAQPIVSKTNKKRTNSNAKNSNPAKEITASKRPKKNVESISVSSKSVPSAHNKQAPIQKTSRRRTLETSTSSANGSTNISVISNVKLEALSAPANVIKLNSIEEGKRVFQWLLNPVKVDNFFAKYWEQNACLIQRQQSSYFSHLISFEAIDKMLLENHVEFTKNIDVTSYKKGVRETLNPEGRALPPVVWDHYGQGCSIRLLNPQTFLPALYTLSTTMQEYFHCLVGANAYLTPPNSQGFAPHYDDIEAFVLQIEGRKRWKLYSPRNDSEVLPRYSSKNFSQEELGNPVMEQVLEPGDVLYFPRGTIHQACTEPGFHSLHITLSVYQKQSFADLFEKMLPIMLEKAINGNVAIRKGLPLDAWHNAGIAFSDNTTKERANLKKTVTQLMHKFIRDMPLENIIDSAIDQLAKKFQHEALPPEILPAEKLRTVFGSRNHTNEHGECVCDYDVNERTNVRLLRANILRLIEEEGKLRVYYYLDNSKEYCQYEPNFIEIDATEAASIEVLIKSYPQYIGVSQLPLPSDELKINLAAALWERGLLIMEKPFR